MINISLLQENLNKAVGIVGRSISSKAQLPVLTNILLSAEKGRLKLAATNLETGISLWVNAKTNAEGKITVPAKIFGELVSSLPAGEVHLEQDKDRLKISCGRHRALINTIAADEFPAIPAFSEVKKQGEIRLGRNEIKEAVERVSVAAGTDEARPIFTGIKIEVAQKGVRMAATDGYRLAVKVIGAFNGGEIKKSLVVPARSLVELARNLEISQAENLVLAPTDVDRQLIFSLPEMELVTRLIEGDYPDFDKIIPKSSSTKVELGTEELRQAVKAAAVFARDSANIIRFKLGRSGAVLMANSPQVGENQTEIEAKTAGESLEIAFNARYLLDLLGAVKAEKMSLECSGSLGPGKFSFPGDDSWLHIIMPVRLQGE